MAERPQANVGELGKSRLVEVKDLAGCAGEDTRLGKVVAEFLSEDEALRLAERCLGIPSEQRASAATIIDGVGRDRLKRMLLSGTAG